MKFIKDIFVLLKIQLGQIARKDGKTLSQVIEYTAFFVALIYLFDKVIARGLLHMINFF